VSSNRTDINELREILVDTVQDSRRAAEIIQRARLLVKKDHAEFALLDVGRVIDDVLLLVHSDAVLRNIRVTVDLEERLPSVRGDRVQLQQVLLNLVMNAFDSMEQTPARDRAVVVTARHDARQIVVTCCDSGTGLDSDILDRMFQPFYTTKPGGLGMGLSISRSIVQLHGGRLWAENNADGGASFRFTLPVPD
jgi:two-component system sensor kinase FixL